MCQDFPAVPKSAQKIAGEIIPDQTCVNGRTVPGGDPCDDTATAEEEKYYTNKF